MAQAAAIATVVSILGTAYFTEKQAAREKKATKKANALAEEAANLERQAEENALKETQRRNRNLLAQQQSIYKAKLGASGLTSTSGSGQVVLDAMARESDMEDKYLTNKTSYALKTLNNRLQQTNNRNLLTLDKLRLGQQRNVLDAGTRLGQISKKSSNQD